MSEKMITIPTSLIMELMPYIKFGLDKSAEAMGEAGYSPSEEMADDFNRFKILKSLLEYE